MSNQEKKSSDLVINVSTKGDGMFISQPAKVEPRRVEWSLLNKKLYITPKLSRLPRFLWIVIVVLTVCFLMFVLRPHLIKRQPLVRQAHEVYIGDLKAGVEARVILPDVELFSEAKLSSNVICSLLLNEQVTILADRQKNFYQVRTNDDQVGYLPATALAVDHESNEKIEGLRDVYVLRGPKRVMSDARSGNVLLYLNAGTKLTADYQNDGLLRLVLPDGRRGWINEDEVQVVKPNTPILHPAAVSPEQYFLSAALMFKNATYVPHGLGADGIDLPGVIYVSGLLNNLHLPRTLEGISQSGTEIQIVRENGEPSFDALQPGDVIIFGDGPEAETPRALGILVQDKRVLMNPLNESVIREYDLAYDNSMRQKVIGVRRLFN